MFHSLDLSSLNYLAIVVSGLAYFVLGALWYSKLLFATSWMGELGINPDNTDKSGLGMKMLLTFVAEVCMAFCIAVLIYIIGINSCAAAVKLGLLLGVGFSVGSMFINYQYESRSTKLLLINGGYHVAGIVLAATILCNWR